MKKILSNGQTPSDGQTWQLAAAPWRPMRAPLAHSSRSAARMLSRATGDVSVVFFFLSIHVQWVCLIRNRPPFWYVCKNILCILYALVLFCIICIHVRSVCLIRNRPHFSVFLLHTCECAEIDWWMCWKICVNVLKYMCECIEIYVWMCWNILIAGTAPEKGGPKDCLKYDITTLLPPFQGEEVRFGHFV